MVRKYSVNVENDEVISVEVDGIRYDDLDQIPDVVDRRKVRELLSKPIDAGFDLEFEDEFRALGCQSDGAPKIIVSVFMGIGALMLVIALISTVSTIGRLSREASAPGRVVDMTVRQSRDSETQTVNESYYPVVEFNLPDGTHKRVQLSEGSWPPEYEVGQPVTVLYDPQNPLEARIKSFSSTILKWILPGITGIIGAAFLGVTILVQRFMRSDSLPDLAGLEKW